MSKNKNKNKKAKKNVRIAVLGVVIRLSENRVASELFKNEPQVVLHRSHGWTNHDERAKMAFYARNGIPLKDIAARFCVTTPTVYFYKKDTRY